MAFKKYNKKVNGQSLLLLAIAFILLLILFLSVWQRPGRRFVTVRDIQNSPPVLAVKSQARAFEILSKSADGYKARALDNQEEVIIIMAEKNLKPAVIVILKKYITAANGLVAQEAQILPPVPGAKPESKLPDRPE